MIIVPKTDAAHDAGGDSADSPPRRTHLAHAAVAPAAIVNPPRAPGEEPRVLVVEDDETCRRGICRNLRLAGYAVIGAADGVEALDMLEEHGADVIVTDLKMPNMDGVNLILSVVLGSPRLPIIAITGTTEHDACIEAARQFGAKRIFRKPFGSQSLVQAIAEALED